MVFMSQEQLRRDALSNRIALLEDFHILQVIAGLPPIANGAVEYERIIAENDTVTLKKLEAAFVIHNKGKAAFQRRQALKQTGRKAHTACKDCLNIIRGWNAGKPTADIISMKSSFIHIYTSLIDGMPNQAKMEIAAVVNDGVIDSLKADLLEDLTMYGY